MDQRIVNPYLVGFLLTALVVQLQSQEFVFQREVDSIPVIVNNDTLVRPFAGGINETKPTYVDIDNDGDFDMFIGESHGNIHFYLNVGTPFNSSFMLVTEKLIAIENFSQSEIDVGVNSSPTFADIDNDGDFDLFIGKEDGRLSFYQNTGTVVQSDFSLETLRFSNIDVGHESSPTFVDIDSDGDLDLFVGEGDSLLSEDVGGNINFYRNIGTPENPSFMFETETFENIDVGGFSHIAFVDIDGDDDLDLFSGELGGTIHFYRNIGTSTNSNYEFITNAFASIDVRFCCTAPTFVDIDSDGDFDLFVGEWRGNVYFYRNIGSPLNSSFSLESLNLAALDLGADSAPTFADIDNDNDLDFFVGKANNSVSFFRNTGTLSDPAFKRVTINFASVNLSSCCSTPVFVDLDRDQDLDLLIGEDRGNINLFRNDGTQSVPFFLLDTDTLDGIDVGRFSAPTLADIDGDGDYDMAVGENDSKILFFDNIGSETKPTFVANMELSDTITLDNLASPTPTFGDVDNDGDLDLFIGGGFGKNSIIFYRNVGDSVKPQFNREDDTFLAIANKSRLIPTLVDIDADGDLDIFSGEHDGGIFFYRNVTPAPQIRASASNLDFGQVNVLDTKSLPLIISNDGDADLILDKITIDDALFSVTPDSVIISTSASAELSISFTPDSVGSESTMITINSNASNRQSLQITVTGMGMSYFTDVTMDAGNVFQNGGSGVAWGDYDNDGDLDIVISSLHLLSNSGDGTFQDNSDIAGLNKLHPGFGISWADYDNDSDLDSVAASIGHPKRLQLLIGRPDFVEKNLSLTQNIPQSFELSQNFPNPFNPTTTIRFGLPKEAKVTLKIYNILGEEVATLVHDEPKPAGFHVVVWDGRNRSGQPVASGVFVYRLNAGERVLNMKMLLIR